jgi:integral membrane sensor domain MASE1
MRLVLHFYLPKAVSPMAEKQSKNSFKYLLRYNLPLLYSALRFPDWGTAA